jgi:hypothetical protein
MNVNRVMRMLALGGPSPERRVESPQSIADFLAGPTQATRQEMLKFDHVRQEFNSRSLRNLTRWGQLGERTSRNAVASWAPSAKPGGTDEAGMAGSPVEENPLRCNQCDGGHTSASPIPVMRTDKNSMQECRLRPRRSDRRQARPRLLQSPCFWPAPAETGLSPPATDTNETDDRMQGKFKQAITRCVCTSAIASCRRIHADGS